MCFCTPIADDYTITPASSMSTIVMGATPAQACITVSTVFDSMMEPEETFAISWEPTMSYVNFVTSNETTFTIRDRKCVHVCTCALQLHMNTWHPTMTWLDHGYTAFHSRTQRQFSNVII